MSGPRATWAPPGFNPKAFSNCFTFGLSQGLLLKVVLCWYVEVDSEENGLDPQPKVDTIKTRAIAKEKKNGVFTICRFSL
jgi:hypothetical protein